MIEDVPPKSNVMERIATLNPMYFALVMATGIVSIAAQLQSLRLIAVILLGLNVFAFTVLWVLYLIRVTIFPRQFFSDLADHRRGVGFFTMVAGSCVLGNQFLIVVNLPKVALALWCLGIALWFVLTYSVFLCLTVKVDKPSLAEGIHGGWLVSIVATQAVAVLGGMLASGLAPYQEQVLFFALTMWLAGGMLYILIISLIFYRYSFLPMDTAQLAPAYWINMGAMAISTLAGATLISVADDSAILSQLKPFLKGFTLFFWATATWWIPLLLVLGVWRHIYKRFRITYDPQYWGLVFPLGMYATSTYRLSQELGAPYLQWIPVVFTYVALAAWLTTVVLMVWTLIRRSGFGPTQPNHSQLPK